MAAGRAWGPWEWRDGAVGRIRMTDIGGEFFSLSFSLSLPLSPFLSLSVTYSITHPMSFCLSIFIRLPLSLPPSLPHSLLPPRCLPCTWGETPRPTGPWIARVRVTAVDCESPSHRGGLRLNGTAATAGHAGRMACMDRANAVVAAAAGWARGPWNLRRVSLISGWGGAEEPILSRRHGWIRRRRGAPAPCSPVQPLGCATRSSPVQRRFPVR